MPVKPDLVIAADFGTSSVKLAAIDEGLVIRARATADYPLHLGPGGRAEQDPEDWWQGLIKATRALCDQIPDLPARAAALSMGVQICGAIAVAEDGRALRPCLTWLDKRAAPEARALTGGFPQAMGYNLPRLLRWLRLANGAPARNGMDPPAKFLWLKRHEPQLFAEARWLMDAKDWLILRLTGRATTSPESANLTWMMDSRPGHEGFSPRLAAMTGLPLDKMPPIHQGDEVIGPLSAAAGTALGLGPQVQVMGGASDVTVSALGSGQVADGALHICAATSAWIAGFMPGRRLSVANSIATISSALAHRPLLIASQENAGSALDWAERLTAPSRTGAAPPPPLAQPRPDDPFFLPWLAGERVPLDDEQLRGAFLGLALHHDAQALRRAALEGVVLNLQWAHGMVTAMRGVEHDTPISLVGGIAAEPAFGRALADALGRDIHVGAARYAGPLGAATLAAPALGWADTVWEAASQLADRSEAIYRPDPARARAQADRAARLSDLRSALLRPRARRALTARGAAETAPDTLHSGHAPHTPDTTRAAMDPGADLPQGRPE